VYWKAVGLQTSIFGKEPSFFNDTTGYLIYDTRNEEVISCIMLGPVLHKHEIYNVCTTPRYRRKGFAKLLLSYIIQTLKNVDIFLHVDPANRAARALYNSTGFKETDDNVGKEIVMKFSID